MTDPVAGCSPDYALAATLLAHHIAEPTKADMESMYEALESVDPRPPLTDYEAWIAEGVEAASEVRAFERSRASLMGFIYGDLVEEAA